MEDFVAFVITTASTIIGGLAIDYFRSFFSKRKKDELPSDQKSEAEEKDELNSS